MTDRLPVVLRTDVTPSRLQEMPAGDLLPMEVLLNALKVALTGLPTTTGAPVVAADTILAAIGKLVAQTSTYTNIPTINMGPAIIVTSPHIRHMVWNGTKYVRAPWHRPGRIVWYDGPAANVTDSIMMRSDVLYSVPAYPDLAEYYGFTGSTFSLTDARARVMRAADNGRNFDTALVNKYLQEDAIRNLSGVVAACVTQATVFENTSSNGPFISSNNTLRYANLDSIVMAGAPAVYPREILFDASRQVPTAAENRVKSFIATPYVVI